MIIREPRERHGPHVSLAKGKLYLFPEKDGTRAGVVFALP
jgi:hypothetical protein